MKEIKSWIIDPSKSVFGRNLKERAKGTVISCDRADDCEFLKKGICAHYGSGLCPHGHRSMTYGYTRRALKYSSWISEFKEDHKESIDVKLSEPTTLSYFLDYVYMPILHWNVKGEHKNQIVKESGFLCCDKFIIPRSIFTAEFILKEIINYTPTSWFGDIIGDYHENQLPKFIRQLRTLDIDLYNEVRELSNDKELFNITDVGRIALLSTLNPGEVKIGKDIWRYDGEFLYSNLTSVFIINGNYTEIRVKPNEKVRCVITDDNQVNSNTEFID